MGTGWATITSMNTPPVCDYEGSDYQQQFWEAGGRAYEDAAEELALKYLMPKSGQHLLELGAGAGRNTPRYQGFQQVTLLDYSTTQLNQAIDRLGRDSHYRFVAADVYCLPFGPNSFDAATMIRTLHHLSDPHLALKQIQGCLSGEAVFILEFANKRNLKSIARYLFGRQDWNPFSRKAVEFAELNYDFHPTSVKEMLIELGFIIEKQIGVSHLRMESLKRSLPLRILMLLESFLQRIASWMAYSPSVFLRTRVRGERIPLHPLLFRCPSCGHFPIEDTPPVLTCDGCGMSFPFADGIYDFHVKSNH